MKKRCGQQKANNSQPEPSGLWRTKVHSRADESWATRRSAGPALAHQKHADRSHRKLNREINTALADPKIKAQLADLGSPALAGSPADFGKHIADETEKWAKVIKFAGIKPE